MSVVIRLSRAGGKDPIYHVVATDKRNPRDGKFIESFGSYNPNLDPPRVEVNMDRLKYWRSVGATPSETVAGLLQRFVPDTAKA